MIDFQAYCYPEFRRIMQTYKIPISYSQEYIIKNCFSEFYEEQSSKGIIDDVFMTSKKIYKDKGYLGDEINKVHNVESWQRTKCLSAPYQRKIRMVTLNMYDDIAFQKVQDYSTKYKDIHDGNNTCTHRLLDIVPNSIMPQPHDKNADLSHVRLVDFDLCLKGELREFIYVQLFFTLTKNTKAGFQWPKNKGKFDDGEYNYVVLAHKLRANGIILE